MLYPHRVILAHLAPLVTQEHKALKEKKEREAYLESMELRVLRYVFTYIFICRCIYILTSV